MQKEVRKAVAYITRLNGNRKQVLVFEHQGRPEAGVQVPAGTVESNESVEEAVVREVKEEAGLNFSGKLKYLGEFNWHRADRKEVHLRNIFHLKFDAHLKDEWFHLVSGHGEDSKMIFRFYWEDTDKAINILESEQGKYLFLLE